MKKKSLVIISLFLLVVFLPFVQVDSAISSFVDITNPHNSESFEFSDTSEIFTGYYQATGYSPSQMYITKGYWYIDSVLKTTITGSEQASGGGVITEIDLDYVVDPSDYAVGEHSVKLKVEIILIVIQDTEDHTNVWYRSADPNNDPVITVITPASDYEIHNRTLSGNDYLVSWSVDDDDGTISSMAIYFDGVLNYSYSNPVETTWYRVITCASDGTYTILINCTDDDAATDSVTIHLVAITGGTGYIVIIDPDGTRHSERISFVIESNDLDGLNNLSVSIHDYELETSIVGETCNLTYDQLVSMGDSYQAINYSVDYSSVQNWTDDFAVDDSGANSANWYTSSEGWDWIQAGEFGERYGGVVYMWEDTAGAKMLASPSYSDCYRYPDNTFYYEYRLQFTNDTSKYEYIYVTNMIHEGVTDYYLKVLYHFSNSSFSMGCTDDRETHSWQYGVTTYDYAWAQNEFITLRIAADCDNNWAAYYVNGDLKRNSTADMTNESKSKMYYPRIIVDNAAGQVNATVGIDYFKTGWGEWITSDAATVGLSDSTDDLIAGIGVDYYVNFTSTSACRFWATITTTYMITYWIYESSTNDEQTNNWDVPAVNWTALSEGDHVFEFNIGDDNNTILQYNRTYTKDTTAPTITITLPSNASEWFVSETPSLSYQLDWGGNDGDSTNELLFEMNYNATNNVVVSWVVSEPLPDRFPACDRKIVDSFGSYYVRMRAIDSAGNVAVSAIVYFTVYNERTISISATSQYDASSIDVGRFLRFYVNGIRYEYSELTVVAETFDFAITDVFGNELYNNPNENYASTKSYPLPLRRCALTSALGRLTKYVVVQDGGLDVLQGYIASQGQAYIYLFDGLYNIGFEPVNVRIADDQIYVANDYDFTCSSTSNSIILNAEIMNMIGGGSDTSDIEEMMVKFIVGVSIAMVVLLAFVVVKDSLGGLVKKGYAKARGREYRSKEDAQAEKNYYYREKQERRIKDRKKRKEQEERSKGFPEKPVYSTDDYRRRYGKK